MKLPTNLRCVVYVHRSHRYKSSTHLGINQVPAFVSCVTRIQEVGCRRELHPFCNCIGIFHGVAPDHVWPRSDYIPSRLLSLGSAEVVRP